MRTNYIGFALAVSMGLVVVLLGFLALSAGGLVQLGPAETVAAEPGSPAAAIRAVPVAYVPASPQEKAAIAAGDALFKANCVQCHAVNEKVVGPALGGIEKRRSKAWVVAWVHNSAKVIASGDDYAVKLFEDNNRQQMPAFPQLTDADITNLLAWVHAQESSSRTMGSPTVQTAVAAR